MDNNLPPQQPTPPTPETPQGAPIVGQGPTVVTPGTTTPIQPVAPQAPIQHGDGKNKGLIIVAVILVVLISVLGIIYYMIVKQSTSTPEPAVVTKPASTPTPIPPTPTPTITDEEILDTELEDPATEITPLQQDATSL